MQNLWASIFLHKCTIIRENIWQVLSISYFTAILSKLLYVKCDKLWAKELMSHAQVNKHGSSSFYICGSSNMWLQRLNALLFPYVHPYYMLLHSKHACWVHDITSANTTLRDHKSLWYNRLDSMIRRGSKWSWMKWGKQILLLPVYSIYNSDS